MERWELQEWAKILDHETIPEHSAIDKIVLGVVKDCFEIPLRRKLLSQANKFSFNLEEYQALALWHFGEALSKKPWCHSPQSMEERFWGTRVYELLRGLNQ